MTRERFARLRTLVDTPTLLLVAVFALLIVANAWISDDAFITFRSVDQLFAGHGPRWNPHERVQAFTHPLWFFALAASRVVSSNLFIDAIVLSVVLTTATVLLLRRVTGEDRWRYLACLALLCSSRAFVDYSTSGLENPLAALLITWLYIDGFGAERAPLAPSGATTVRVVALTAAVMLCRHDLVLLIAPLVCLRLWEQRPLGGRRLLRHAALGATPFIAWTMFSIIYYGVPFPNTAYAKLSHGVPAGQLWIQGTHYAANLARWDVVTAITIVVGIVVALRSAQRTSIAVGFGQIAYLLYVTSVGGDFMAGRFYTQVFLLSLLTLSRHVELSRSRCLALVGLLVIVNAATPNMPCRYVFMSAAAARHVHAPYMFNDPDSHGIQDEKSFWFRKHSPKTRSFGRLASLRLLAASWRDGLYVADAIGATGYLAGPDKIMVDRMALSDPLLARLPATPAWRIGHFERALPDGYLESVRSGENRIENPIIHDLYDTVKKVTQGPLFTRERWQAIAELNLRPPRFACGAPPCLNTAHVTRLQQEDRSEAVHRRGGAIEEVRVKGAELTVLGWLPMRQDEQEQLCVLVTPPQQTARTISITANARPDVARALGDAKMTHAGFTIRATFDDEASAHTAAEGCVICDSAETAGTLIATPKQACDRFTDAPR